jgi:hypothetical protein
MPTAYIKKAAQQTGKSVEQVEKYWEEAKKAIKKGSPGYWGQVVNTFKKMVGLKEDIEMDMQFQTQPGSTPVAAEPSASAHDARMANLMGNLMKARNVAHMWHWKVKSFSKHMALGELYDGLSTMMDDLMEMYMGRYGTESHIPLSDPNAFSESDPIEFVRQLDTYLGYEETQLPPEGFILNKFQELQALVSKVKYKLENLA